MVPVLRALAAAVVAAPGMDTATSRANVAVVLPGLLTYLEAAAASGWRLRVLTFGPYPRR
jgi:hypothetical protein